MKELSAEFPMIEDRIENLQDVFNIVWEGARKMSGKSENAEIGSCAYRGDNGSKCFIGMCIDNDDLAREMDEIGTVGDVLIHGTKYTLPAWFYYLRDSIEQLQDIHDDYYEDWETRLGDFAAQHNLTIPGPWHDPVTA